MALLYFINNSLVDTTAFEDQPELQKKATESNGIRLKSETLAHPDVDGVPSETPQFQPIGIGKPLSIEIVAMYVGNTISGFLSRKKDVLLVSGVKGIQTFGATSKAINYAKKSVEDNDYLEFSATVDSTPIVYYSKAMDTETTLVSFEFIADSFNEAIFQDISKLFTAAAGIPVFVPAAGYLLGGASLIKTAGELGNTLFAKTPFLGDTLTIRFGSPLFPITQSQLMLICNDKDVAELKSHTIKVLDMDSGKVRARLVDSNGSEYTGDAPYLIISLDGRERTDLEQFTPTLASAALLQQFYGNDDVSGQITSSLQDALKLYSDSVYNKKADDLKKKLASLPSTTDEFKKAKQLFDAYNQNINNDAFKVKLP